MNIFGGITRGDEVAHGLIEARKVQTRATCRWSSGSSGRMPRRRPGSSGRPTSRRPHRWTRRPRRPSARRGRARAGGRRVSILVGPETRLVVQGITGREGEFHARAMQAYGTPVVAGVTPGKGGQSALDGSVPVYDTVSEAVRETGRQHVLHLRPGRRRADAILEAATAGIATIFCITEGIPALDMVPVVAAVSWRAPRDHRPNCPGATSPGSASRDHPREPSITRRPGGRRVALRDADVRGVKGDERRRDRPVDLCGDRRRPDHRLHLPRCAQEAVRGGRRDAGNRPDRRDRRGRGGGGREYRHQRRNLASVPKAAFIAGRTAPEGKRMGHAGAIISEWRRDGSLESLRSRQRASGSPALPPSCRSCSATRATALASRDRRRRRSVAPIGRRHPDRVPPGTAAARPPG